MHKSESGKAGIVILIILAVILITCISGFMWYTSSLKAVQSGSRGKIEVIIDEERVQLELQKN